MRRIARFSAVAVAAAGLLVSPLALAQDGAVPAKAASSLSLSKVAQAPTTGGRQASRLKKKSALSRGATVAVVVGVAAGGYLIYELTKSDSP
jgi:hypothetical protein